MSNTQSTPKLLPTLEPETGWTEQLAPELVKFEKPGETISGILTQIAAVKIEGRNVRQYTLTLGEKKFRFLGSFDLLQKLGPEHRGCQVRVKYLGQDSNIRGGPNNTPMKVFSVQIKGTPTPAEHGGPITDEDVPF
jgi:hypothetical protein